MMIRTRVCVKQKKKKFFFFDGGKMCLAYGGEISHENKLDFDVFIPTKTTATTNIYLRETNNGVINQMAL